MKIEKGTADLIGDGFGEGCSQTTGDWVGVEVIGTGVED